MREREKAKRWSYRRVRKREVKREKKIEDNDDDDDEDKMSAPTDSKRKK